MAYGDLRQFVAALEAAGELARIKTPVSPILEITEITDRVSKGEAPRCSEHARITDPRHFRAGGKALLFENVQGSHLPLLINAYGSYRRMEMALGCETRGFDGLARRLERLVKPEAPTGLIEKLKRVPELAKLASLPPKVVRSGPCQEVVKRGDEVDLLELPIIKCWPHDGDLRKVDSGIPEDQPPITPEAAGRYVTFAGVYTAHPDDAAEIDADRVPASLNVGMYRCQVLDKQRTAMHWHMHHDGARHWRAWKEAESRAAAAHTKGSFRGMPCALAFGGESVLPYVATAPMPPGISELLLAGFLHDAAIPLVPCVSVPMLAPANAEIVIEGYVSTRAGFPGYDPDRLRADGTKEPLGPGAAYEGPFGDHTGFYSLPDRYPIFQVTAITHRRDPIYPTTIVGLPPQEDYYLGKATERIFLPLLRAIVPDVTDYDLPMFGAFHNCAFVKIRKEYPLQARRVMHALWGAGQLSWTKFIVVVDADVDVHDHEQVLFHLCANCAPGRDVEVVNGPVDILDHSSPRLGAGQKMGFDATRKIPGEEAAGQPVRPWPDVIRMSDQIKASVSARWGEYGL